MHTHYQPAVTHSYIGALAAQLAEDSSEDEPEELLDWTAEEEASWAEQDKIDLYRNEY